MAEVPHQTPAPADAIQERISKEYEWGFVTDIEEDKPAKGLNEDVIRAISARKNEPEWLLEWRLKAYRAWLQMDEEEPTWANIKHPKIDFQDLHYYSAPKQAGDRPKSLDEVDPEIRRTFDKLGIPLVEQMRLARTRAERDPSATLGRHLRLDAGDELAQRLVGRGPMGKQLELVRGVERHHGPR